MSAVDHESVSTRFGSLDALTPCARETEALFDLLRRDAATPIFQELSTKRVNPPKKVRSLLLDAPMVNLVAPPGLKRR